MNLNWQICNNIIIKILKIYKVICDVVICDVSIFAKCIQESIIVLHLKSCKSILLPEPDTFV